MSNIKCIAKRKGFINGSLVKPGKVFYARECPTWAVEAESDDKGVVTTLSVRDVLLTLKRDDDHYWTKTGSPSMKVLSDIAGYKVTKADVDEAWPGFHRDMMAHGDKNPDGSVVGV